jgi:uncharacterized membrane protein (DUF2068 family)
MDWSLLGCGASGHVTFAPDEPGLRERLGVSTREGAAWRCLRCGTFVIGEPTTSGPVSSAPRVRRGKELRSALILRVFAVERGLRAVIFGALAVAIWQFSTSRMSIEQAYDNALPELRAFLRQLGFNVNHSKLLGLIQHAFKLTPHTLTLLALAAGAYAAIEVIEAVGLWLLKRWGEYFAMIATSVGIPYEIYDLTAKVTALRVVAFVINVALVVYLVVTKRLFGVRGGKKAYEVRLRSASILQAEVDALASTAAGPATTATRGQPGQPGEAQGPRTPDRTATAPEQPATAEPAGEADQPGRTQTAGQADQPGRTQTAGQADQPGRAQTAGEADQPPRAEAARGPDQPTDAAATSSSAAE